MAVIQSKTVQKTIKKEEFFISRPNPILVPFFLKRVRWRKSFFWESARKFLIQDLYISYDTAVCSAVSIQIDYQLRKK